MAPEDPPRTRSAFGEIDFAIPTSCYGFHFGSMCCTVTVSMMYPLCSTIPLHCTVLYCTVLYATESRNVLPLDAPYVKTETDIASIETNSSNYALYMASQTQSESHNIPSCSARSMPSQYKSIWREQRYHLFGSDRATTTRDGG